MESWWKRAFTSWQMGLLSFLSFLVMLWDLGGVLPKDWETWVTALFGGWNRQMVFLTLFLLSFALLCIHIGFVLARDGEPYRGLWGSFGYFLARLKEAWQKIGWVKVRYGIAQYQPSEEDPLGIVSRPHPQMEKTRTRVVWKGRVIEFVIPRLYGNDEPLFLELPEPYRALFPHSPARTWTEYIPEDRPGYRQYARHPPIKRPDPTDRTPSSFPPSLSPLMIRLVGMVRGGASGADSNGFLRAA